MNNSTIFTYVNNNPHNKITSDCVIRSISLFLNQDYLQILYDLLQVYMRTGYHIGDPVCFMYYLSQLNKFTKVVVPELNKLTLKKFCVDIQNQNYSNLLKINSKNCDKVLVLLGNSHLTFLEKGVIMDIGDCSNLFVNTYWVYGEEQI